jgi:hypothetical protein
MRGIVFGIDACLQDDIVAGVLALGPQPTASEPKQRIEPVHGSRNLRQHLEWPVQAADMSEFMRENDSDSFLAPSFGIARNENLRPKQSPGSQHVSIVVEQSGPAPQTQRTGDLLF